MRWIVNRIDDVRDFLDWLEEKLHREQCEHFLVTGGDRYLGQVYCQKSKGHWGKHRCYQGKKF